jgi:hypothetical protein
MSTEKELRPADSAAPAEEADKLTQGVARFAKYTAPTMLAMLVSGGHNTAVALASST